MIYFTGWLISSSSISKKNHFHFSKQLFIFFLYTFLPLKIFCIHVFSWQKNIFLIFFIHFCYIGNFDFFGEENYFFIEISNVVSEPWKNHQKKRKVLLTFLTTQNLYQIPFIFLETFFPCFKKIRNKKILHKNFHFHSYFCLILLIFFL